MFNYQFGTILTLPQIDRIRWHLFPEIRIDGTEPPDLFTQEESGGDGPPEEPPMLPEIVKILDIQQV
ncbi:MAG: hypothetical protein AB2808_07635 [Candidatus Sedimenticola endophacoides]